MKYVLFGFLNILTTLSQAQDVKQEVEKRIKADQMPQRAITYLESLDGDKKRLKYYFEQDGERQSYEAKFKLKELKYSVEFHKDGRLQDIEIIRSKKEMGAALDQIEDYLKANYARHRIEKIQAHYNPAAVFNTKNPGKPDGWELIVATKNSENTLQRFEMTFDATGNFTNSRKVVRRSYEFLLF